MNSSEDDKVTHVDIRHQLWLLYIQLKDAETDPERQFELLQRSRGQLAQIINQLNASGH